MSSLRWAVLVLASAVCSCTSEKTIFQTAEVSDFEVVSRPAEGDFSATPAFADERGGGLFIDLSGRVTRVRANGQRGPLESHPQNPVAPGPAIGLFALGPTQALAATTQGLFVADQGWLIAPPWQQSLSGDGLVDCEAQADGTAWLVHQAGLFRLSRGALNELRLDDGPVTGVVAAAIAPTLDRSLGIWFAREGRLFAAKSAESNVFSVQEADVEASALEGGVLGLAGIAPAGDAEGELWVITPKGLLNHRGTGWRFWKLPAAPRKILSAGRYAWVEAGDALFFYDADQKAWARPQGLGAGVTLLAVDAAGTAWVRVGAQTTSISRSAGPRILGLMHESRVFDGQLVLEAVLPSATPTTAVTWAFDDDAAHDIEAADGVEGAGPTALLRTFSLGGRELSGEPKPVSLSSLSDGWHDLVVTATTATRSDTTRIHFDFRGATTSTISWQADVRALGVERCSRCHASGTQPELVTYAQWKANAAAIAADVRAARMPADGPLDSASVALIVRWANGGALP